MIKPFSKPVVLSRDAAAGNLYSVDRTRVDILNGDHDVPAERIARVLARINYLDETLTPKAMSEHLIRVMNRRERDLTADPDEETSIDRYAADMTAKLEDRIIESVASGLNEAELSYAGFNFDKDIVGKACDTVAEIYRQRGFSVFQSKLSKSNTIEDVQRGYMPPLIYKLTVGRL